MDKITRVITLKKLNKYFECYNLRLCLLGIVEMALFLLILLPNVLYMLLIEHVFVQKDINWLFVVIIGYIAVYILEIALKILNKYIYNSIFFKMKLELKANLIKKIIAMKPLEFDSFNIGDLKKRVEDDTELVEKFYSDHILNYFFSLIKICILILILLRLSFILALIGIVMIPISFVFTNILSTKAKNVSNKYREIYGDYEGCLFHSIQNWKEIKSHNLLEIQIDIFKNYWNQLSKLFLKKQLFWFSNRFFIAFKDLFITNIFIFFIGGILAVYTGFEIALLLGFMNFYKMFYDNICCISDYHMRLKIELPYIERIINILSYKSDFQRQLNSPIEKIEGKNLSFRYQITENYILQNVNFTINKHDKIAIIGKSGCGKTTFLKILLGFYEPSCGEICYNEYNVNGR